MLELEEGNFGPGSWRVKNATLSAHWNAPAGGADNYAGSDLEYDGDVWLGRPLIWVAEENMRTIVHVPSATQVRTTMIHATAIRMSVRLWTFRLHGISAGKAIS